MQLPASVRQAREILRLLGENPTQREVQNLLNNSDLIEKMLAVDLSKVDRGAFASLLRGSSAVATWTPVAEYEEKIMARSKLRGWKFSARDGEQFASDLREHHGALAPTGVSIWLGHSVAYNWSEAIAWLKDELNELGLAFKSHIYARQISLLGGIEMPPTQSSLGVVDLDLETYWDPVKGIVPRTVRQYRSDWPGLEVPWTLALNPWAFLQMGKSLPSIFATGLVADRFRLPCFIFSGHEGFCLDYKDGNSWRQTAVAAYREG